MHIYLLYGHYGVQQILQPSGRLAASAHHGWRRMESMVSRREGSGTSTAAMREEAAGVNLVEIDRWIDGWTK